ncbi:MAG TPA: tyrosine-type recombinase/integrase [Roseiarcus sp.]|jgi:integrase
MIKRNGPNERIKRRYLQILKETKGRDEASLDAVAKAIDRFEEHSKNRDFKKFHVDQARAFKASLTTTPNVRTGEPLSASTIHSTLAALKTFFIWLAQQPGYRSRLKIADAEYFNPPDNLSRVATARRYKACPTVKQVRAMLDAMPASNEIEQRDRALIAFALLSGARDRAIVSFNLKHIDIENELIEQDAREVRTKRAKTFTTWFFPVGDDIRKIVVNWVAFLREKKGFGPDDPLFPKSRVAPGDDLAFRAVGLDREPWTNANPVRAIFKEACALAGLPYFNPHSIRNTLVQLAYERKLDAERFKAWSQNLGHENCLTTFSSYGEIPPARQAEIIRELAKTADAPDCHIAPEFLRKLADQMERATRPAR